MQGFHFASEAEITRTSLDIFFVKAQAEMRAQESCAIPAYRGYFSMQQKAWAWAAIHSFLVIPPE